jgi:N-methylhydantoinase A/oxoprolinase/acetone carboxylase beta subunit
MATCRVGIDIGGTFTDFVIYRPESGSLESFKLLSTPQDPAEAVLLGLNSLTDRSMLSGFEIVHGSTVATNALLERKGALTALITTQGFRDVLQIGRHSLAL